MPNPKIFKVNIADSTTYFIKDEEGTMTEEEAVVLAQDWFSERKPGIYCEELESSSFHAVDAYC